MISMQDVIAGLKDLPQVFPKHLERADKQDGIWIELREFDRTMILKKYAKFMDT